jgi:putative ABC transport system permease protein
MSRPRWRKVLADLWGNKSRTLLVIASIAVGVFAIGVIAGTYMILAEDLNASYAASHPANITIYTYPFDPEFLDVIQRVEGVDRAEGRREVTVRVRIGEEVWDTLRLIAIPHFTTSKINIAFPTSGQTVPDDNEVILEHLTLQSLNRQIGDHLVIELEDGTQRTLPIVGASLDQTDIEELILGENRGFITYDTLSWLHAPQNLNQLYVTVNQAPNDEDYIRLVADKVTDRLEKSGRPALRTKVSLQNVHPLNSIIEALLLVLIIMGVMIVFLSGSLIFNTMSALLGQHLRQIGVIKLVGGRRLQIISMYVVLIMIFGAVALLFSIPLGALGADKLAEFAANIVNFQQQPFRLIPSAIIMQAIVALVVPPVAGILPVLKGSTITVREALTSNGITTDTSTKSWLDRILFRIRNLPRPILISLRNTFRRKGRLLLTLATLTLGGAVFIAVFNTQASLDKTTAQSVRYFGADVSLDFTQPYRVNAVKNELLKISGVQGIEVWTATSAELMTDSEGPGPSVSIIAPPADSKLIVPKLLQGRWLLPGDQTALAVNEVFWQYYPNLKPGDQLQLDVAGREDIWTVVGIFRYTGVDSLIAYASYDYLAPELGNAQRATMYRITTTEHSLQGQLKITHLLESHFRELGYTINNIEAGKDFATSLANILKVLTIVLLVMALMTAMVGSIGLTGTMTMNVMERTREIGVLRAIGGHNQVISQLVIVEGLIIGMLSYMMGMILSIPISYLLSNVISHTIFDSPAEITYTPQGFLIWLAVVVVLSILASLLPAKNATNLTIREVLAYE